MFKALVSVACVAVIAIAGLLFWQERQRAEARALRAQIATCDYILSEAESAAVKAGVLEAHPFRFTDHPMHPTTAKCVEKRIITAAEWYAVSGGQRFSPMKPRG